jgi:hypothetical protein
MDYKKFLFWIKESNQETCFNCRYGGTDLKNKSYKTTCLICDNHNKFTSKKTPKKDVKTVKTPELSFFSKLKDKYRFFTIQYFNLFTLIKLVFLLVTALLVSDLLLNVILNLFNDFNNYATNSTSSHILNGLNIPFITALLYVYVFTAFLVGIFYAKIYKFSIINKLLITNNYDNVLILVFACILSAFLHVAAIAVYTIHFKVPEIDNNTILFFRCVGFAIEFFILDFFLYVRVPNLKIHFNFFDYVDFENNYPKSRIKIYDDISDYERHNRKQKIKYLNTLN